MAESFLEFVRRRMTEEDGPTRAMLTPHMESLEMYARVVDRRIAVVEANSGVSFAVTGDLPDVINVDSNQNNNQKGNDMEDVYRDVSVEEFKKIAKPGMKVKLYFDRDVEGEIGCVHGDNYYLINAKRKNGEICRGGACDQHGDGPDGAWSCHFGGTRNVQVLDTPAAGKKSKKLATGYKPGMNIQDYVTKVLKTETDKDRIKWLETFKRCVLPENVRRTIEEAITIIFRKEVYEKWGINDTFEKGLTNSILLYGPAGTGKTMISESIAAVLGKKLIVMSNSELQSSVPGETEKNIQKFFASAKKNDAVLMLDECDSMLSDRESAGIILGAEINELLTQIERHEGVVVLTTNRLHRLDPALQRRIIAKVELKAPDKPERVHIWQNLIPKKMPLDKAVDYDVLADYPLTGGEIKNAILLAARSAIARNEKKVKMTYFHTAIEGILKSKDDYNRNKPKVVGEHVRVEKGESRELGTFKDVMGV